MKGLILAGGLGTRLRPFTQTGAKQLVPVANRPVLFYAVDNLVGAGVTEIGVIISPETGAQVQAALGDGAGFGARFTFVLQNEPAGLAHAVLVARPFLGDDPFVMYLGDNLIGMPIRDMVLGFLATPDLAASLMLREVTNPSSFGVAEVDAQGDVIGLVEKPKKPRSNLALVGIYLLRADIHEAIARVRPSARGELEITDALSELLRLGRRVSFVRLSSWWLDTGKKDDLLLANDTVLESWLVPGNAGTVDGESRLEGRVRVGKGTSIVRSTIRGPVIIGDGVSVMDAEIGPLSSIGDRAQVVRSHVAHSILMADSRVIDVARLEDSVIGQRVLVHPGNAHAGALSLTLGDDCVVEVGRGERCS